MPASPDRKKTYFISDLHLGAAYIPDRIAHERSVCAFLDEIAPHAANIFLLGDILDYWYEYRYVVPKGYVRFFGKLAQLADSGINIEWIIGNHDIWIFDYLPSELGIKVVDGSITREIGSRKFFLAHGDGLGSDSAGFRFIRSLFRNKICQKLFSGIHPRWTVPFAHKWSSASRSSGNEEENRRRLAATLDSLEAFCRRKLSQDPEINHFIFGHLHTLDQRKISAGADMTVIGDWITNFSYAEYDGNHLSLISYPQDTEVMHKL